MEVQWIHLNTIDSTSVFAKTHAEEFDPQKMACITADLQTAGRGRFARKWASAKGNLHLSLFFCIPSADPILPHLAQLFAYAVAGLLLKEKIGIQIKWPNDLILEGKKLGGILVEAISLKENRTGIVIGFGMNVNTPIVADQPTTSLFELTGKQWDLIDLQQRIVAHFQVVLKQGFSKIRGEFEALLAYRGEKISCRTEKKSIEGTFVGIDEMGCLKIEQDNGTIATIYSGEITLLRPLKHVNVGNEGRSKS